MQNAPINPSILATSNDRGLKRDSRVVIEWRVLTCPKGEYTADTTEDRWAANAPLGLFAVADGVGSSYRAADWARALVEAWTQEPFRNKTEFEVEWWVRRLQPRFALSQAEISQLQPYAQDQARKGAGSTLLGLRLWPASDKKSALYQLLCIGDSDLIHYPQTIFPISNPKDFGSYPTVLRSKTFDRKQDKVERYPDRGPSDPKNNRPPLPLIRLRKDETLLLCTDAIAKWAIETDNRAGRNPELPNARALLEAQTSDTWQAFVEELRHKVEIVDDDTTALFIRISPDQHGKPTNMADAAGWRRVELTWPAINEAEKRWTEARRAEMASAQSQNPASRIEIARIYGDGKYFIENYGDTQAVAQLATEGRALAYALDEINGAIRGVNWDNPTRDQRAQLTALQQRHEAGLANEPQAQGALRTLRELLSRPEPPPPPPSQPPQPQSQTRPPAGQPADAGGGSGAASVGAGQPAPMGMSQSVPGGTPPGAPVVPPNPIIPASSPSGATPQVAPAPASPAPGEPAPGGGNGGPAGPDAARGAGEGRA